MTRTALSLGDDDLTPLLQATASRSLDTCLRGARGLAVLGDPRAFGLLLQLSREQDPPARVEVCRALAALEDPRAADRLRSLMYDADAAVRDAAEVLTDGGGWYPAIESDGGIRDGAWIGEATVLVDPVHMAGRHSADPA